MKPGPAAHGSRGPDPHRADPSVTAVPRLGAPRHGKKAEVELGTMARLEQPQSLGWYLGASPPRLVVPSSSKWRVGGE